jgi:hypothetical protein
MKKADTLKGHESWDYGIIDDALCISFKKPVSKYNISYAVAMAVLD